MSHVLEIFVQPRCMGCEWARDIAALVRANAIPGLRVNVVDLSDPAAVWPPRVFATPTYILDGQIISLGNPDVASLLARLSPEALVDASAPRSE